MKVHDVVRAVRPHVHIPRPRAGASLKGFFREPKTPVASYIPRPRAGASLKDGSRAARKPFPRISPARGRGPH